MKFNDYIKSLNVKSLVEDNTQQIKTIDSQIEMLKTQLENLKKQQESVNKKIADLMKRKADLGGTIVGEEK